MHSTVVMKLKKITFGFTFGLLLIAVYTLPPLVSTTPKLKLILHNSQVMVGDHLIAEVVLEAEGLSEPADLHIAVQDPYFALRIYPHWTAERQPLAVEPSSSKRLIVSFPIEAHAPPGTYNFWVALTRAATDDALCQTPVRSFQVGTECFIPWLKNSTP